MKPVVLLLLAALASACGTTHIITPDAHARIFVDGELVGRGQAEVRKRGLPGSATVVAKTEDGRTGQQTMSRSFTFTTFLMGVYTYLACMVACWEYPDTVFVYLDEPAAGHGSRPVDPWTVPPPGWVALPWPPEPRPPSPAGAGGEGEDAPAPAASDAEPPGWDRADPGAGFRPR